MAPAFAANSSVGDFNSNAARLRCSFPLYLKCSGGAVRGSNHGHKAETGRGLR